MNIAPHCWTRWPPQKNNVSLCPRCPFLHRTAGDTERRYHLRYYKTGSCIHETDAKGHCSKNGSHCAFAHGSHDLRSPVYDIRCGDHFILTFDLLWVSVYSVSLLLTESLHAALLHREVQVMESQGGSGPAEGGGGDGQSASTALIEKILSEEPRWQGRPVLQHAPNGEAQCACGQCKVLVGTCCSR